MTNSKRMSEREYLRRMRDAEGDFHMYRLLTEQFWRFFEVAFEAAQRDVRGPDEECVKRLALLRTAVTQAEDDRSRLRGELDSELEEYGDLCRKGGVDGNG